MFKFVLVLALMAFVCVSNSFSQTKHITLTERNTVAFNRPVKAMFVAKKQLEVLSKVIKLYPNEPLYLVMDTPGGSVTDGLLFIDTLKALNHPIHTITIFAASMGYQIVQELGARYVIPSGTLMSHRGAVGGLSGQVPGELNSRLELIEDMLERMNVNASRRIGMSVEKYKASIVNELWSFGHKAVQSKQADAVAIVQCDKALIQKTEEETVSTIFGEFKVTFSACPLITAPVDFGNSKEMTPNAKFEIIRQITNEKRKVNLTF